jgi:hypothetical protein
MGFDNESGHPVTGPRAEGCLDSLDNRRRLEVAPGSIAVRTGVPVQNPERPISSRPRRPLEGHVLPTQPRQRRRQEQLQPHLGVTEQGLGPQGTVASSAQPRCWLAEGPDSLRPNTPF